MCHLRSHTCTCSCARRFKGSFEGDGKIQKFEDLAREIRKIWQVKVKVVPTYGG